MKTHALGISNSKKYRTCMRLNSNAHFTFIPEFQTILSCAPEKKQVEAIVLQEKQEEASPFEMIIFSGMVQRA